MDILRFYLNGDLREIDFSAKESPPLYCSVLHYLRKYEKLTGTKEVCGRGDCGACTVILASKDTVSGREKRFSVDSCLMRLPQLHGKHLLTIEAPDQYLNTRAVKKAFLKERASQCGFCSPGMVLSTYIHVKNQIPFNREDIQRSLSGNLCRCSGYQAIMDAALFLEKCPEIPGKKELPLAFPEPESKMLLFKQDDLVYVIPSTLQEFYRVRKTWPVARIAAGFTGSCMDYKSSVIDISHIPELTHVKVTDTHITLGAACNFETMKKELGSLFPYMMPYLDEFASLQVRNQATLGGNIADGSPVGDTMPLCLAHDAVFLVAGPHGTRSIEARRFTTGYRQVALKPGELILAVEFPRQDEDAFYFAHKQARRRNMDISSVSFVARVNLRGKTCRDIRLAYGGMAAVPTRSMNAERFLKGKIFSLNNCRKASALLEKDFTPLSDVRGSATYRMDVAKNMLLLLYESYTGNHD